ncbi:hypothetical protein C8Q77DRAFT_1051053 [Trametes polyzona]|nr:hypothetical protein C8Q77DRAFT_1051053 [Trametes polyzona]
MNAAGQHRGARELPPETWVNVFSYATYIPGALSHEDGPSFVAFSRDKYGISVHRRHREATDFALAASRVCKAWSSLAMEFLLQYILIRSGDHAVEVAAALTQLRSLSGNHSTPGRWTVRLELALEGVHRWDDAHSAALTRILALCPNLAVFSTAFSTADASLYQDRRFLRSMRDIGMYPNLKRLELKGDGGLLDAVLPLLAPSLRALWLLPSRRTTQNRFLRPIHFPVIHSFVVSEGFGWGVSPPPWPMPSLRTLCMEDENLAMIAPNAHAKFFEEHGPQLQHLSTCRSTIPSLPLCTNLVECTFPCGLLVQAARLARTGAPLPPTLRDITLVDDMSMAYMLLLEHVALLVEWLEQGLLPSLETIRFLLPLGRHIRRQRPRVDWEQAIASLHECSKRHDVRLEASIGGDEHTAGVWRTFSVEHLLDSVDYCPSKHPFSTH